MLVIALGLVCLILGGGVASIERALSRRTARAAMTTSAGDEGTPTACHGVGPAPSRAPSAITQ